MITERPIPGQSLTTPPQSQPYEKPPQITDAVDALDYHVNRLNRKESKEDIIDLLELDVDIVTITEGVLRRAVMNGIHSIDISIVIAPHIHEFIKGEADALGIDYDEGFEDKKEDIEAAQEERIGGRVLREVMKEMPQKMNLEKAMPETVEEEPMDEEPKEDIEYEVGSKGLMARVK
jgi:hypothetical protein